MGVGGVDVADSGSGREALCFFAAAFFVVFFAAVDERPVVFFAGALRAVFFDGRILCTVASSPCSPRDSFAAGTEAFRAAIRSTTSPFFCFPSSAGAGRGLPSAFAGRFAHRPGCHDHGRYLYRRRRARRQRVGPHHPCPRTSPGSSLPQPMAAVQITRPGTPRRGCRTAGTCCGLPSRPAKPGGRTRDALDHPDQSLAALLDTLDISVPPQARGAGPGTEQLVLALRLARCDAEQLATATPRTIRAHDRRSCEGGRDVRPGVQ